MTQENPARDAADRVRKAVSILQVLAEYGYPVHPGGGDREQQFPCDLHGDGRDSRPSARVYPSTNSWHCFACTKTRDVIETVRAKEGLTFWQAVKKLEKVGGLEAFKWTPKPIENASTVLQAALDPSRTFDQDAERVRHNLDMLTYNIEDGQRVRPNILPMETVLTLWEAFDRVVFRVKGAKGEGGEWSERKGREALAVLNAHINTTMAEFLSGVA